MDITTIVIGILLVALLYSGVQWFYWRLLFMAIAMLAADKFHYELEVKEIMEYMNRVFREMFGLHGTK